MSSNVSLLRATASLLAPRSETPPPAPRVSATPAGQRNPTPPACPSTGRWRFLTTRRGRAVVRPARPAVAIKGWQVRIP
ncbi:hypothetical protein GCM10010505_31530 [Kitasatospora aburaviensis]